MHKFKIYILPVNFKPYLTSVNKIHIHLTRVSETNYFFQSSLYGLKSLSYLDCRLWEELPRNLKYQSYIGTFQFGLRDNLIKRQSENIKLNLYIPLVKLKSLLLVFVLSFLADCCWSHKLGLSRAGLV